MLVRLCHSFLRTSFWEAPTILFGLAHPKAQSSCLPPPKSSLDLRMPSGCWVRGGAGNAWVPKEAFTKRSRAGAASARKPQQMGKQELLVKFTLNLAFWGVCVCVLFVKIGKTTKKSERAMGKQISHSLLAPIRWLAPSPGVAKVVPGGGGRATRAPLAPAHWRRPGAEAPASTLLRLP